MLLVLGSMSVVLDVRAATKYPGLNYVLPLSVPRGATTVVAIDTNGDVTSAYKALIEGEGVTARVLPREKKQKSGRSRVELTVAADAAIGPREIRLATKQALTTLGRVYVTHHSTATEAAKNDSRGKAQKIELPIAVNGRVEKAVDEDWYRFQAKKGQRVTFTVLGVRMHETIHKIGRFITHFDPLLTLTDADGNELAANDDHYLADPLLSHVIPKDGVYHVRVQEATYKGNAFYTYTLVGTTNPWPTQVQPFALAPGKSGKVLVVGPGYVESSWATVTLPPATPLGVGRLVRPLLEGELQEEIPLLACDLPARAEREDNDSLGSAQSLSLPSGLAGVVARTDDVDHYSFTATKGNSYEFETHSRRLFAPLDSELAIFDAKGKRLARNDDFTTFTGRLTKDSRLSWKAPADGVYTLAVRDALGRGGPEFSYHLRARQGESDFALTCDPDLAMIGPNNRTPIYVRVERKHGFSGPVKLVVHGLPKGVSAHATSIHPRMKDACIVLAVAEDAPIDAANIRIEGTAELARGDEKIEVTRAAVPLAEIYQARRRPVRTMAVAVTEPSDIAVETPVHKVELRPGESQEIPITIRRADKYKKGPVTLWGAWRFRRSVFGNALPAGVSVDASKSKVAVNGSATEGMVTLTASADAKPIEKIQTVVIGQVAIEFSVFVPYCTEPIEVSVLPKR